MQILKDRIQKEGVVEPGDILDIGSFFSQQVDVELYNEIGKEFYKRFSGTNITRILTVETSGIGIACVTAQYFKVPVVIARKFRVKTIDQHNLYTAAVRSYTLGVDYTVSVPKAFLTHNDTALLIDDFLANGHALDGLIALTKMAKAQLAGAGIVIEKGFQNGGNRLRENRVRLESLAIIESMSPEGGVRFRE